MLVALTNTLQSREKNHVIPQICYVASKFIFPYKTILIGVTNSVNRKIYRGPGVPPMLMFGPRRRSVQQNLSSVGE